ncbi:MAG: fumarylacetoacetate hydrolase family protein [Phycisphaerales bacterium JB065]
MTSNSSSLPLVGLDPSLGATVGIHLPGGEVMPVRHIIGVGRNYKAHADEQGASVPDRPMLFTKNPAAACLDGEAIRIPPVCTDKALTGAESHGEREQVDFEGELAVVIGQPCRDLRPDQVLDPAGPVLGVTCSNDVSARWWQKSGAGGQFCRGKSFDTFCPLGPVIVPLAALGKPAGDLRLVTRLNGEVMQDDTTASMIFPLDELVAEISRGTTLLPGTVILTGTPSGVGMARSPQVFLQDGDTVEIEIEGVGTLSNPVQRAFAG